MATGLVVTKLFVEKCQSLCTLIGKSLQAKVITVFRHKDPPDTLIQLAYILVDV